MLKQSKDYIYRMAEKAAFVEVYQYISRKHSIHTDNIEYVGNSTFDNTELMVIPFNADGDVKADVVLMDKEEYSNTVLANCGETWENLFPDFDEDDKVLVIVLSEDCEPLTIVAEDVIQANALVEYAANLCGSDRVAKAFGKPESDDLSSILADFVSDWESVEVDADGATPEQDKELDAVLNKYQKKILTLKS